MKSDTVLVIIKFFSSRKLEKCQGKRTPFYKSLKIQSMQPNLLYQGHYGWDYSGSSNMEELQLILEEYVMIRYALQYSTINNYFFIKK